MPFKSLAQRNFLYKNEPEIAKKWEEETPKDEKLPDRIGKTRIQKAKDKLKKGMMGKTVNI